MKRMIHKIISVYRDHRASVAVEMAIIAPVLIFLVFGIVDYAMYVMDSMRVAKGVASAVQFAMYNSDNDEGIRQVAYTASKFTSSQASIDIQHLCECPNTGSCADNCPNDNHQKILCLGRDAISVHTDDPLSLRDVSDHQPQRYDTGALMNACFRRDEKGVAAIEFAFIGPILFILILGVADLGRYFWIGHEVDHAIEIVLRDAAVNKNLSEFRGNIIIKSTSRQCFREPVHDFYYLHWFNARHATTFNN